jgi:hypothetical protein
MLSLTTLCLAAATALPAQGYYPAPSGGCTGSLPPQAYGGMYAYGGPQAYGMPQTYGAPSNGFSIDGNFSNGGGYGQPASYGAPQAYGQQGEDDNFRIGVYRYRGPVGFGGYPGYGYPAYSYPSFPSFPQYYSPPVYYSQPAYYQPPPAVIGYPNYYPSWGVGVPSLYGGGYANVRYRF